MALSWGAPLTAVTLWLLQLPSSLCWPSWAPGSCQPTWAPPESGPISAPVAPSAALRGTGPAWAGREPPTLGDRLGTSGRATGRGLGLCVCQRSDT